MKLVMHSPAVSPLCFHAYPACVRAGDLASMWCLLALLVFTAGCHRVRWLGHAACKPNDVMVKQLLFAHSIPGHPRPMGRPHLMWMDTAMHDMGSLGHMLQIDLPRDWANLALYRNVWRGVVSRC